MIIRKATVSDFRKLKDIKSEFYLWECKTDKRSDPGYVNRGLGSRLAKNLRQENTAFFVAEEKGNIVGMAGAEVQKNPAWLVKKTKGHLFNLYVRPKYQGKGIGKALISRTMQWFKEKRATDLEIMVYPHNKKAYCIYSKLGFDDYIIVMKK
jgi:GNAT superfamily N-acetyltransferase